MKYTLPMKSLLVIFVRCMHIQQKKKIEDIYFHNLESWPVHRHWSIVHSLPPLLAWRPFSWHQQPSTKPNPSTNRTKNITWVQQPCTTKPSHLQIFNYNIILLPHLMFTPTPACTQSKPSISTPTPAKKSKPATSLESTYITTPLKLFLMRPVSVKLHSCL